MAVIDKIYGTDTEWEEFHTWAEVNRPTILKYFYPLDGFNTSLDRPITNLPEDEDMWLLNNCPLTWVLNRIVDQYGLET
jgi:hypothetical protein